MRVILDIEADSLTPTRIWCVVTKDIDNGTINTYLEHERRRFLEDSRAFRCIVGHNLLGYDVRNLNKLWNSSIKEHLVVDTLVVSRWLNFNLEGGHSLEAWGQRLGKHKKEFSDFSKFSPEMLQYCIQDVEVNYLLYKKFEPYVSNPRFARSLRTEHDMAIICEEIKDNGFHFNVDKAKEYASLIDRELLHLDSAILNGFPPSVIRGDVCIATYTKSGSLASRIRSRLTEGAGDPPPGTEFSTVGFTPFNPASPSQIVERLNDAGWKPVVKTKGHITEERKRGKDRNPERLEHYKKYGWSVCEENLETLPDSAPPAAKQLARRILLASRLSSLNEWLGKVGSDSRIHGNLWHIGAWTHRMSHDDPNTANIPSHYNRKGQVALYGSEFRSLWNVPKGRRLVGVDAEGIQLRVLAHYMNDEKFTEGLVNGDKSKGTDIHSLNRILLGTDVCLSRDVAKTFIYSWILGAGEGKTATVLGCSVPRAKVARESFLGGYPGLKSLKEHKIPSDASRGYFEGLDGRYVACKSEHLMLAGYLQNGEAVILKTANILWRDQLRKERIPFWQVGFIHDEWQTETLDDDDLANYIADVQIQSIVKAGEMLELKCPLAGSKNIGYNWNETH